MTFLQLQYFSIIAQVKTIATFISAASSLHKAEKEMKQTKVYRMHKKPENVYKMTIWNDIKKI